MEKSLIEQYIASYAARGITLDPFQIDACRALDADRDVLVCAPTGSGKTVVARYAVELALSRGKRCIYTAPIKALSNQKYHELAEALGADTIGLLTGDTSINPDGQILVVTTEVLRNMLLHDSPVIDDVAYAVLDEVHYLADRERGPVWEEIILSLPPSARLVSLSATVSNTDELVGWLSSVRGSTALISSDIRPVPLSQHVSFGQRLYPLYDNDYIEAHPSPALMRAVEREQSREKRGQRIGPKARNNIIQLLEKRDLLPAIEFIFSRKSCDNATESLLHLGVTLTTKEEQKQIRAEVEAIGASLSASDKRAIDFSLRSQAMIRGYSAHHAGVYPPLKELTEQLMSRGLLKLVYATGTLALGIDMPVRTVVLEDLTRWDGSNFVDLSAREYTQLIGRAGRRGKDSKGYAIILGTSRLDPYLLAELGSGDVEELLSAFYPSYNTIVNLLERMPAREARGLIARSFAQYQRNSDVAEIEGRLAAIYDAQEKEKAGLECDRGDVHEYLLMREHAPRAHRNQRRKAKADYHRKIQQSFLKARTGYAYAFAREGRLTYGLVLSRNGKKMRIIDWDGNVSWLREDDVSSHLREVGECPLPHGLSVRSPDGREQILDRLADCVLERADLGLDRDLERSWDRLVKADDAPYVSHPCHSCPDRDEHIAHGRDFVALDAERQRLTALIDKYVDSSGRDFDRAVDVLCDVGLVRREERGEVALLAGARSLQSLHLEADLLLYECLMALSANQLDAEEMVGWTSLFLMDDRLGTHLPSRAPLRELTLSAYRIADRLRSIEYSHGIERTGDVTAGCADTFVLWAQGAPLEECLKSSRLTAGDFINAARRLVDLLGQIALAGSGTWIGSTAHAARSLMRRNELEGTL
ncbi:MAG: DEAD/DEAH box helicase [Actinomycetaceae bacterium]|nr:DEAD/DEAH box helicase [Actinomycetaceae bacterium]